MHELEARVVTAARSIDDYLDGHKADELDAAELDVLSVEHRTAAAALEAARSAAATRASLAGEPAEAKSAGDGDFGRFLRTGEVRAMTSATGSAGHTVPDSFVAELVGAVENASPFVSALRMLSPVSGTGSITYPVLSTDLTAASIPSVTETGSIGASSDLVFGEVELTPTRYGMRTEISRQLLVTTGYPVEALLQERYAEALSKRIEALALARLAASTTTRDVGTSGSLVWGDLIGAYMALPADYRRRGSWVLSDDVVTAVAEATVGSADNRPVATMGNSWRDGVADQLVGRPAFESTAMAGTLATASDVAFFADLGSILVQRFGDFDLVRDEVSQAAAGKVVFVLNVFYDVQETDFALISKLRGKA